MKVVNNKIYITRGETATYDLNLKYLDDDSPFRLVDNTGKLDFIAVLTIKSTIYDTKPATNQLIIDLKNAGKPIFSTNEITDIKAGNDFTYFEAHTIVESDLGKLFKAKRSSTDDTICYGYAVEKNGSYEWVKDYKFSLDFPFDYDVTAKLESKKYVYDVNIFWGSWDGSNENGMTSFTVAGKQIIIEPTELQVGGSLSG